MGAAASLQTMDRDALAAAAERYRVPAAEYTLPDDLEFSPAELALLTLAGSVWSESSMSVEARAGLRKIRALGIPMDAPIQGFAPRLSTNDAAFVPLQQAIEHARVVTFPYLKTRYTP